MINFNHYDGDSFQLFLDAIERKNAGVSQTTLLNIRDKVKGSYETYKTAFVAKSVHLLDKDDSYTDNERQLLKGLYGSQAKVVKDIRKWIDEHNKKTYLRKCPYCTISRANTTEHILPKDDYPEFAINALNLLPCCSDCNSLKGTNVRDENGNPLILNFYYHHLPNVQYLFVRLIEDRNGCIDFEYYLDNSEQKINASMYQLIQSHFEKLRLLKKFEEEAIVNYTEIENMLIKNASEYGVEKCLEDLRHNALEDAKEYGRNHWKVVLKLALAESDWYAVYLEKQVTKE